MFYTRFTCIDMDNDGIKSILATVERLILYGLLIYIFVSILYDGILETVRPNLGPVLGIILIIVGLVGLLLIAYRMVKKYLA